MQTRLLLLYFLFNYNFSFSQTDLIDSLKTQFRTAKHDTVRVQILTDLYYEDESDNVLDHNQAALELIAANLKRKVLSTSEKLFYSRMKADIFFNIGTDEYKSQRLDEALQKFKLSKRIYEELKDESEVARLNYVIGNIYLNQGKTDEAVYCFIQSLNKREKLGEKLGVANTLMSLGQVYKTQGEAKKAYEMHQKALVISTEINELPSVAYANLHIGSYFATKGDYLQSIDFSNKGLEIALKINSERTVALAEHNIGSSYHKLKQDKIALEHFAKSLELSKKTNDRQGIGNCLSSMGFCYLNLNSIGKAIEMSKEARAVADQIQIAELSKKVALLEFMAFKKAGNHDAALKSYEEYILLKDSITNESTRKATIKSQLQYEYAKKSAADSVKNAEQQKVIDAQLTAQNASLKQEKTQRYVLYGGLILVVAFLIFVFNRFRITRQQKKVIEEQKELVDQAFDKLAEKNKEVLDSIYYARRIQRALMPSDKLIDKELKSLKKRP